MDKFVSIHIDREHAKPLYIQIYEGLIELMERKPSLWGKTSCYTADGILFRCQYCHNSQGIQRWKQWAISNQSR